VAAGSGGDSRCGSAGDGGGGAGRRRRSSLLDEDEDEGNCSDPGRLWFI